MNEGIVVSVNLSTRKGDAKVPVQGKVVVEPGWGIVGDVHGGTPGRELTLLPRESLGGVSYGGYGENIDTEGLDILTLPMGTVMKIGTSVRLAVSRHGKVCQSRCAIYYRLGNCIMQESGVFAVVLDGGEVSTGDYVTIEEDRVHVADIGWVLDRTRRIALLGASPIETRASFRVMKFLLERGYDVVPVRPGVRSVLGRVCFRSVADVPGPVDLVLIFRRSDAVLPAVRDASEIGAQAVWMQEGVIDWEAFQWARQRGLKVIMDRCILKELSAR